MHYKSVDSTKMFHSSLTLVHIFRTFPIFVKMDFSAQENGIFRKVQSLLAEDVGGTGGRVNSIFYLLFKGCLFINFLI